MSEHVRPRILIIGAGAMGIITGYFLSLGGANVVYLIRPHRAEALDRPQILYCYDDNKLKEYKGYTYITDPSEMVGTNYDYILITLDGAALRNEVGRSLAKTIGEAVHQTNTKVILGTVFFNLKPWFLQASGLTDEEVVSGYLSVHAYSPKAVTLPLHAPTDPELLAKADLAYTDRLGDGFNILDDSTPEAAKAFVDIYNASGVSHCSIKSATEHALSTNPFFAIFAACQLLNWPKLQDIGGKGELWSLAVAAFKEIQGLSIHGEPGQQAVKVTTEAGLAEVLAAWEKHMLPLEVQEFNRYHHGGKVNKQDCEHLEACLAYGEAEGKPMPALKELLQRVEHHQVVVS